MDAYPDPQVALSDSNTYHGTPPGIHLTISLPLAQNVQLHSSSSRVSIFPQMLLLVIPCTTDPTLCSRCATMDMSFGVVTAPISIATASVDGKGSAKSPPRKYACKQRLRLAGYPGMEHSIIHTGHCHSCEQGQGEMHKQRLAAVLCHCQVAACHTRKHLVRRLKSFLTQTQTPGVHTYKPYKP